MGNAESAWDNISPSDLGKLWAEKTHSFELIGETEEDVRSSMFLYLSHVAAAMLKEENITGIMKIVADEKMRKDMDPAFEAYIVKDEPDVGFEKLKAFNKPAPFCGKVFNVGDPTYTCKDCAADPTCVFCHDCFHKSLHVTHRYRMHTSSGCGGYCDCGDQEAWKKDPSCEMHQQGAKYSENENPVDALPVKLAERVMFLYNILLPYCVDMLLWTDNDKLPSHLQMTMPTEKCYITMLFNDEVHTYDEVIRTLQQAIQCDQAEAVRYATVVDKEGRSLICSGTKKECEKVAGVVTHCTSRSGKFPLKCEVIHRDVVAHQLLAIEIMDWLNKIVSQSDALKRLLCETSMGILEDRHEPLLDEILKADTYLWKVARASCHQLFMNSVLIDPYGKKHYAITFARNYRLVMKDFIADDHDHLVSTTSMSVQIFTVPTLAQMLILEHNILHIVLETFYEHLKPVFTTSGHIDFQNPPGGQSVSLKRAYYVLHDIGYLLHHKPEDWTPELRLKFLDGFNIFLELLRGMQEMDKVTRKHVIHIEFEPNWESGFLLQFWMMPIIEAMLSWCCSDFEVLKNTTKMCLLKFFEMSKDLKYEENYNLEIEPGFLLVNYDVTKQPASVHMALSRFIAGLLTGCSKYGLYLQDLLQLDEKDQHQKLALMEYSLRTLVLSAQVSAGMWRRNGYAILNQVSYYQNVRCVSEMYDRDIVMLQAMASLMDGEYFLTIILEKYGLLDWINPMFDEESLNEDSQRQMIVISEEFLMTLLAVLSERHIIGIGKVSGKDILKRETIHRLALGPASRSDIVRNLPSKDPDDDEECNFESQLDDVLQATAEFRKPGLTGKGLYVLKQEYLQSCCQYFYHYSRSEQSKALEQRRKESKRAGKTIAYTVPTPPDFCLPFSGVTKLFRCMKMVKILVVVLLRCFNGQSKITPDTVIEETLHIIALGILEEKRKRENSLTVDQSTDFIALAIKKLDGKSRSIRGILEDIQTKHKSQEYSELVNWVVDLLNEELSHRNNSLDGVIETQKRKQEQFDPCDQDEKARKAAMAIAKREKIMAQMSAMQKAFIKNYKDFLDIDETNDEPMECENTTMAEGSIGPSIAIGPNKSFQQLKADNVICILCQEKQDVTAEGRSLVLTAFVQRSKVLSRVKGKSLDNVTDYNPLFTPADLFTGVYTSSCGHVIHSDCWQEYYRSVVLKDGRHFARFHQHTSVDVAKHEYLCPLCGCLCNTALPLLPEMDPGEMESFCHLEDDDQMHLEQFLVMLQKRLGRNSHLLLEQNSDESNTSDRLTSSLASKFKSLVQSFIKGGTKLSATMEDMMKSFSHTVYNVGLGAEPDDNAPRVPSMAWATCAYTIQCIECLLRDGKKSLFGGLSSRQSECLGALVRFAALSSSIASIDIIKRHCIRLLTVFSPDGIQEIKEPSIVDLDLFGVMVNLRFALPSLNVDEEDAFPKNLYTGGNQDYFILRLALIAKLIQILIGCPNDLSQKTDKYFEGIASEECLLKLCTFCEKLKSWRGIESLEPSHSPSVIFNYLMKQCLPFLRCSALLFHFLTGVRTPAILQDSTSQLPPSEELQIICSYLGLPSNIIDILPLHDNKPDHIHFTESMIKRWCAHECVKKMVPNVTSESIGQHIEANRLILLPTDYCTLISAASGFKCPITKDPSRNPALCLICGEMLCSQSYCCQALVDEKQIGSCTAHAQTCSDSLGIFLRVRECEVLLLFNGNKGCFLSSPYLDAYGEPDHGFRRGNPLYLCNERYINLQRLWLSHSVTEEIVRRMELSRALLSYDWAQL